MSGDALFDLPLGEKAKDRGQVLAAGADRTWAWKEEAMHAIYDLAGLGGDFTADDVVRRVGLPGYGTNQSNAVGAAFSAAAKRGWIVRVGFRKSRRAAAHARMVSVWTGNPDGFRP